MGFNRYIVECKENFDMDIEALGMGFNRYIVECKETIRSTDLNSASRDLIDTLWNVKNNK